MVLIMSRKTVLLVFHDENKSGGTMALLDLLKSWKDSNQYRFIALLPRKTGEAYRDLEAMGIETISFRYWLAVRYGEESSLQILKLNFKFLLGKINTYLNIFKLRKNYTINLVYSNTSVVYTGAIISKVLHVPHIWHVREFVGKDRAVVPLLSVSKHYKYIEDHSDAVITISKSCANFYRNIFNNKSLVHMIYDDVQPERHYINNWRKTSHSIIFVGNIIEGKGQFVAVKAIKTLKEEKNVFHLTIVGPVVDKEYYESIKNYITENSLEKYITFTGKVSNVSELRLEHGLAVIASTNEPFGRVTIEGMQTGEIVFGADGGCTAELINDRENGFLFKADEPDDLVNKIRYCLALKDENIEMLRKNAFNFSYQFCQHSCADKVMNLMENFL